MPVAVRPKSWRRVMRRCCSLIGSTFLHLDTKFVIKLLDQPTLEGLRRGLRRLLFVVFMIPEDNGTFPIDHLGSIKAIVISSTIAHDGYKMRSKRRLVFSSLSHRILDKVKMRRNTTAESVYANSQG